MSFYLPRRIRDVMTQASPVSPAPHTPVVTAWECHDCTVSTASRVTMSVQSLPVRDASIHFRLLQQYLFLLKTYPILTKSITRSVALLALLTLFKLCLLSTMFPQFNQQKQRLPLTLEH